MTDESVKSLEDIQNILDGIEYKPEWNFRLQYREDGFLFQIVFQDKDVITGNMQPQHCRKWWISRYMTESEIVRTVLVAVKMAEEHELLEKFTYNGKRVFDPHFSVNALSEMCHVQEVRVTVPDYTELSDVG